MEALAARTGLPLTRDPSARPHPSGPSSSSSGSTSPSGSSCCGSSGIGASASSASSPWSSRSPSWSTRPATTRGWCWRGSSGCSTPGASRTVVPAGPAPAPGPGGPRTRRHALAALARPLERVRRAGRAGTRAGRALDLARVREQAPTRQPGARPRGSRPELAVPSPTSPTPPTASTWCTSACSSTSQTVPGLADHPLVAIPVALVLANVVALLYWYLVERHYPTVRRAVRRSGLWPTGEGGGGGGGGKPRRGHGLDHRRRPGQGRHHPRGDSRPTVMGTTTDSTWGTPRIALPTCARAPSSSPPSAGRSRSVRHPPSPPPRSPRRSTPGPSQAGDHRRARARTPRAEPRRPAQREEQPTKEPASSEPATTDTPSPAARGAAEPGTRPWLRRRATTSTRGSPRLSTTTTSRGPRSPVRRPTRCSVSDAAGRRAPSPPACPRAPPTSRMPATTRWARWPTPSAPRGPGGPAVRPRKRTHGGR